MESFKIEDLSFTYPNSEQPALSHVDLTVMQGEFLTICGKSGCGKTTLLRLLKSALAPFGNLNGRIFFCGRPLEAVQLKEQASSIGFVMQNPDNQIVTDKVWHELAFGLESLGTATPEIRARVSEMASFFGIQTWFHKNVTELSGGQKQLLNLASVMVMQPSVLILDEPTSQLDPIAAQEFLKILEKINRELGTTVILTEHRLEDAFPVSDRIVVMDSGRIIADDTPRNIGARLKNHDMYSALPTPVLVYGAVKNDLDCPLTVREGRLWLERFSEKNALNADVIPQAEAALPSAPFAVELNDVWFRYEKNQPDVIKGLNLSVCEGEIFAVTGGNGTGKTTALSLISGLYSPYRGSVFIYGKPILKIQNLYNGVLGVLPQNPQALFSKKTVFLDLFDMLADTKMEKEEKEARIKAISALCCIENLLDCHPYDLSGGEQQRAALAKVLLKSPKILLLDEPTKGMDAHFKEIFAGILKNLKASGTTVIMVSHDIEFCAEYADRCAMFFDGAIASTGAPRAFFAGKSFYTTSANRMARSKLSGAVLAKDIILACGGTERKKTYNTVPNLVLQRKETESETKQPPKITPQRIIFGCIFAVLFILTCAFKMNLYTDWRSFAVQMVTIAELAGCFICLLPRRALGNDRIQQPQAKRRLTKRTAAAALLILIAIPLTIYIGVFYLGNKKYYFISLLMILETLIPFGMIFEGRKPEARELIVISVLCAIAVAGRAAFYMLPQFKPAAAVIIICGVCFGGETGFLAGAIVGFVSNFFFGQGPWTPWQMFAFGLIGFIAGICFRKGLLRKTRTSLCVFGAAAALILYGGIMNPATVIIWQDKPTVQMFVSAYVMGVPFDLVHAASTAFFLWFIAEPMIEKIDRIKVKYGLVIR